MFWTRRGATFFILNATIFATRAAPLIRIYPLHITRQYPYVRFLFFLGENGTSLARYRTDVANPNVLNSESRLRSYPHFVLRTQLCDAVVVSSTESVPGGNSGHPGDRRMLCRAANICAETGSHCFRMGYVESLAQRITILTLCSSPQR